jgi:hypothetical protein
MEDQHRVSKSTAMLFAEANRLFRNSDQFSLLGANPPGRYCPLSWRHPCTRLTWSTHIDQLSKKAAQRQGVLGLLLNRKSGLSIRNGVLLYKQVIHPMMDYAFLVWRSAANSHIRKMQVLQSKCLCIAAKAHWYIGHKQIHGDM